MPGDKNFLGIPRWRGIPYRWLPLMLVFGGVMWLADRIKWN